MDFHIKTKVQPIMIELRASLFCFFSHFLKDSLKYTLGGKILENRPRAWRHPRWRQAPIPFGL
jgi:hypothetical protein